MLACIALMAFHRSLTDVTISAHEAGSLSSSAADQRHGVVQLCTLSRQPCSRQGGDSVHWWPPPLLNVLSGHCADTANCRVLRWHCSLLARIMMKAVVHRNHGRGQEAAHPDSPPWRAATAHCPPGAPSVNCARPRPAVTSRLLYLSELYACTAVSVCHGQLLCKSRGPAVLPTTCAP